MSKASQEVVQDTATILDKKWEEVQQKTFTKWVNSKLKVKKVDPIESMHEDFKDGIKLIQLLEVISDEVLGKYNKNPKMRVQQCENIDLALKFISGKGIPLVNIGSTDIADGNKRLILGLVWTIILRFTIADINEEGLSSKAGLLLWCQRKTKGYDGVNVQDFSGSWSSGLAFCALIHKHRPDLLDYDALDKSDRAGNLEKAFSVAEEQLGLPRLLDVEDLLEVRPDERSVMTYVASYFHYFSSFGKYEVAGRRVGNFISVARSAWEMQNDYERRARALLASLSGQIETWSNASFDGTFADAKGKSNDFDTFKKTDKREWVKERQELDTLLGSIQAKLQAANLPPYLPPAGLDSPDLLNAMNNLAEAEANYKRSITTKIREIKDQLRRTYADLANDYHAKLKSISTTLGSLGGTFEAQLEIVKGLKDDLAALAASMSDIEAADAACVAANTDENEFTVYSTDDLVYETELVQAATIKLSAYIENQIAASKISNVTQAQLAEFEETFRHFDKDNSNTLSPHEFRAGLAALGKDFSDDAFDQVFKSVAGNGERITFEEFVNFMVNLEEDKITPSQIRESFKTLAQNKEYLTEADMNTGGMNANDIDYLKNNLQQSGDGYDFNSYLDNVFREEEAPKANLGRRKTLGRPPSMFMGHAAPVPNFD